MQCKKEMVKIIQDMSGKYSAYSIFEDFVTLSAISIYNSLWLVQKDAWKKREQQYINIIQKYDSGEQKIFSKLLALLALELENNISDILGEVYMNLECGSSKTGQFFTPYHLSKAMTDMLFKNVNEKEVIKLNEPSAGGGGMIIACADTLNRKGINYQKYMDVVAQDIDWKCVYMTYVQLSLLGIKAVVVQGNTLEESYKKGYPEERVFRTPKAMEVLP